MCSLFPVRVTNRATQFWILYRRPTSVRDMPNNNALSQSNLEITRAWIEVLHDSIVMYGRILAIQRIWY